MGRILGDSEVFEFDRRWVSSRCIADTRKTRFGILSISHNDSKFCLRITTVHIVDLVRCPEWVIIIDAVAVNPEVVDLEDLANCDRILNSSC
jgi:hypothetical protein